MSILPITSEPEFNAQYPAPPAISWWALFVCFAVIRLASQVFLPKTLGAYIPILGLNFWALYLCMWIRNLNPKAKSIYWCFGTLLCNSVAFCLNYVPERMPIVLLAIALFIWVGIALGIVTIYVIRAELLKHYNEVEPTGLDLGPILTFFFSYIYFQYHLGDISEAKRQQASTFVG